jgi:hypothetical protein
MAVLAIPPLEAAVVWLLAALGISGAAAVAASASGNRDENDTSVGAPPLTIPRTQTRTRSRDCRCPPTRGTLIQRKHGVNWNAYQYQARITGFAFDTVTCSWSEEWNWLGRDFDGFQPEACLLQEAKGNYDQFLDRDDVPLSFFDGFEGMAEQIEAQAVIVHANPPADLMWYFQTPRTMMYMQPILTANAVPSVYQP